MNIVNKITLSHIKQNKKRTLVTIIGIILATAMMTAVFISNDAFHDLMIQNVINSTGKWHFAFSDVPTKNALAFSEKKDIEAYSIQSDMGFSKLNGSANPNKPYIHLEGYTKESFSTLPIHLKAGRLPENKNELLISSHIKSDGDVDYNVGDTITLSMGKRYSNQLIDENQEPITINGKTYYKLTNSMPYSDIQKEWLEDEENKKDYQEIFQAEEKRTYTIVGIMERPNYSWEDYSAPGYTAITCLNESDINTSKTVNLRIYIPKALDTFVEKKEIDFGYGILSYEISSSYLKELYGETYKEATVEKNQNLFDYTGYSNSSSLNNIFLILEGILAAIIMIASVSLIQSAFSISISERSRYLGMLASVGATKRQKRNSVYFEAFFMGIIGIPLGILAGILGMSITFICTSPILSDLLDVGVTLHAMPSAMSILFTVIFSALIIFLSCWIPAKRASRITPLDAIRQAKDIKLTKKAVKTSILSRFIFGIEGDLALKNMKRNKKRYRAVIFSLFISFVLFLCVSGYCFYIKQSLNMYAANNNYDIKITSYDDDNSTEDALWEQVLALDNISESQLLQHLDIDSTFSIEDKNKYYSDEYRSLLTDTLNFQLEDSSVSLIGLSDKEFTDYAKTLGTNPTSLLSNENAGILINDVTIRNVYTWYSSKILKEDNSPIPISYCKYDYTEENYNNTPEYVPITTITPIAYTDKTPLGITNKLNSVDSFSLTIIVSNTTLEKIKSTLTSLQNQQLKGHENEDDFSPNFEYYNSNSLYLKASNPEKLTEDLNKLTDDYKDSFNLSNAYEDTKMQNQLILLVSIFSYGFIALMTAICTANIFNSITTGMALRKREFAMLQSIGMTPRSFYRSIAYESLLYGIKALFYGLPVGILALYGIYQSMADTFSTPFTLPIGSLLFGIAFIFIVVGTCMLYSIRRIKKENIIDALKNENI